jgi:hypothetical protein
MTKNFAIKSADIKPLATRRGSCYATDRITVDGQPVGFMYREDRDQGGDSGWRFMAGDESEDYASDPANVGIYDVNTIANYDRDIIPLLDAPVGSAYSRDPSSGKFVPDRPPVTWEE